MARYKIGLAGYGKMGQALVASWMRADLIETLDILDPHVNPQSSSTVSSFHLFAQDTDFFVRHTDWDILVLAVKPQTLETLFQSKPEIPPSLPVLSILAGKTLMDLAHASGPKAPLIRAMPNTPAAIGKGMTCAVANGFVRDDHRIMAQALLQATGLFLWAPREEDMDAITALSGSGPAYVFYMVEALAQAGQNAGLSADMALALARQTVIGAGALLEAESTIPPAVLRENVTSPNGTTAAGLSVLMNGQMQDILTQSIARAAARSRELSSS